MEKVVSMIKAFFAQLFSKKKPVDKPVGNVEKPSIPPGRETPDDTYKFKPLLGLIVGHERNAPGATMATTKQAEYFWNDHLAKMIESYAAAQGKLKTKVFYRDGVGREGACKAAMKAGSDVVIELHFNAFNGKAFGSETLCTTNKIDVEFATKIQKAICSAMDRNGMSRGVKQLSRGDRAATNVYLLPDIPNCIPEPFFGDNADEARLADRNKEKLARSIHDAVVEWFNL